MRPIDYFDRGVRRAPDHPFVTGNGVTYTFAEADARMRAIASGMYATGFEAGDSVAVYAPNHPEAVICVFAAMRAGGAWVPVNVRASASSNAEYLAYVETRWLFYHPSLRQEVGVIVAATPSLKGVVCIGDDDDADETLDTFCVRGKHTKIPDWSDPFGVPERVFSRWPTGGTTGPSKGVEITNGNMVTMYELGLKHYIGDEQADIVHLAVAPITHAAGAIIGIFATVGGTTLVHESFNAGAVLEAIEHQRVTHIFLPPTAYYALLDHPDATTRDLSSLRQILVAAAPVSPDKFRRGVEVFGPVVCQCYGQAEAPMLVSMLEPQVVAAAAAGDHPERLNSCGQVTSCTQVAILDDEGNEVPLGERGEICCRGPLVTAGYFARPQATAQARQFGWHHTGDIGYLDAHDYLYIVDRKKDMIITGGFNVFATEVEAPILALPGVLECAVIGIPDERWGESIKAVVVLNEGVALEPEQIIAEVRPKLGGVKVPRSVDIWTSIPKTPVGKTDKKALRAEFWSGKDRAVN